jgi:hypothetical protein
MSEWKIFQLNDCDWWVARSLDEAKADYEKQCGPDDGWLYDDPHELTDADMDRLKMRDTDENEQPTGELLTFREYLAQMVADGLSEPTMFASTEM